MQHWDRIEAFVEVVRLGSFARAARDLGVSSSHVSRLVARLETQLGTQLLYRTTRRLTLTLHSYLTLPTIYSVQVPGVAVLFNTLLP